MKNTILIFSHRRGFEADPVIDELRRRGVSVFRFNSDAGDNTSLTSFISESGEVEFTCDGRRIASADIAVGWCQQLPPYLGQAGSERDCLQRDNLFVLQISSLDLLPVQWFNKPCHVLYASNKINQIVAAQAVGLTMPKTLVSNDPADIRSFAHERTIVAKNLATPWVVAGGKTRAAYTRIVDSAWLTNDAALSFAPVIYQEYHERRRDVRIVVVGGQTFVASCIPGPHQREDVRDKVGTGESFKACDFDTAILTKLHMLMHTLQLDYCAADFMEDNDGNLFFLEVNTCGAWWWLDELYDGAICHTVADALISRVVG